TDGHTGRVSAGEETVAVPDLSSEAAARQSGIDKDAVAAAVGHDEVGDAVAVQVGELDRAGGEQAIVPVLEDGRRRSPVRYRHLVERLASENEIVLSLAREIGDGQGHIAPGPLVRPESAVALARPDGRVAVVVADK